MSDLFELRFLPDLLLYGLSITLLYALGVLLFHLYTTQVQLVPYNEPAGARIGFLETTLAVVILFSIGINWLHYGDLQNVTGDETVRLTLLGRSALTLPEPIRSELVLATADYASAIAEAEWPTMRQGGAHSAAATDALQALSAAYATAKATTLREQGLLNYSNRLVRELAEQRENRLASAQYPLGATLHILVAYTLGAALVLSLFFGLPSLATKLVLGTLFSWSLALVLLFNDVLANAFSGHAALTSQPYQELAELLRTELTLLNTR